MLGISGPEFIVLLVVAAVVLGPERLPQYTQQLAQLVRRMRRMALGASEQVRTEFGPEFDEIDWRKLDPRQYDPRRIVREALADTFDPDDPLGLKSVQRDLTQEANDVRQSMTSTLSEADRAARAPLRPTSKVAEGVAGSMDAASVGGAAIEELVSPSEPAAPRFDPDAT